MNPTPPPTLESELLTGVYSEEEKSQILSQIEAAATANRLTPESGALRARKQGIFFPVMVNLMAAVLIAGAWFGANAYFQTRQDDLSLKTNKIFSTESKLLAKVLEDSKNQLAAKNAEIDKINSDMARLAQEKADLQKSFEQRVNQREADLKAQMADALAVEKKRLQDLGYGPDEVARRLREFEIQKNAEFNNRLDTYRQQVQAEIDQRSQAVTALQAKLQTTVADQEKLRKDIETQTKAREKDLQSQLSSQAASLSQLQNERDELTGFFRQTDAAMAAVKTAFDSGDWTQTQVAVTSLRQVLAKASASASEVVRTRAQAESSMAAAFDTAVSALTNTTNKTETNAQLEALRVQAKKEQALAATQLSESQQTLAATEAKWRDAAAQADSLQKTVDELTAKLNDNATQAADAQTATQKLQSQLDDMQKTVDSLSVYKSRFETLQKLFTADYKTAKERFVATLGSEAGLQQFPGFDTAWQDLELQFRTEETPLQGRLQAFDDVLTFTTYLQGGSTAPLAAKANVERLSRADPDYKKVVESIQALAAAGASESKINTSAMQLYGAVAGLSGTKVIAEPLTKARAAQGQLIEIRRVEGKKETVLGQGTITQAAPDRLEIQWSGTKLPRSGDAVYLVLP
jgi:chromosome segregation ATPase